MSLSDGKNSGAVIQGTALVLSCSVLVHNAVNTDFTVNITWSSDPIGALNGQRATVSETNGSGQQYGSSATIHPVNTSDSANFTCTASILPNEISSVIASNESKHTVDIAVQSKFFNFVKPDCRQLLLSHRTDKACCSKRYN